MSSEQYNQKKYKEPTKKDLMPRSTDITTHEIYQGLILDANAGSPGPAVVILEEHDYELKVPKCCFMCPNEELENIEPCHAIKYHKITTKDGSTIELVELVKTKLDNMIDNAIDQIDNLREN